MYQDRELTVGTVETHLHSQSVNRSSMPAKGWKTRRAVALSAGAPPVRTVRGSVAWWGRRLLGGWWLWRRVRAGPAADDGCRLRAMRRTDASAVRAARRPACILQ